MGATRAGGAAKFTAPPSHEVRWEGSIPPRSVPFICFNAGVPSPWSDWCLLSSLLARWTQIGALHWTLELRHLQPAAQPIINANHSCAQYLVRCSSRRLKASIVFPVTVHSNRICEEGYLFCSQGQDLFCLSEFFCCDGNLYVWSLKVMVLFFVYRFYSKTFISCFGIFLCRWIIFYFLKSLFWLLLLNKVITPFGPLVVLPSPPCVSKGK